MQTIYANKRCYGAMNEHCICQNDGSYSFSLWFQVKWNNKEKIKEMKDDAEEQLKNHKLEKIYSPHWYPYMYSHRIGSLVAQEELIVICNLCKIIHKAEITQKAGRRKNARKPKNDDIDFEPTLYCKNWRVAVKNKIESEEGKNHVQDCLDPSESSVNDSIRTASINQRNLRNTTRNWKLSANAEVEKRVTKTTQRQTSPRQKSSN